MGASLLLLLGVAVSIVAAELGWRVLESPAMVLSKRVKLPTRPEAPAHVRRSPLAQPHHAPESEADRIAPLRVTLRAVRRLIRE